MATPNTFPVPDGLAWIADPDESLQRASVAFRTADGVVVVDPVDHAGLDEQLATLGEVTRVLQLLDRHGRDCATVAARHGVAVEPPGPAAWTPSGVDRIPVVGRKRWREDALLVRQSGLAVIAEAVGSVGLFRAKGEPIGVHPVLRLLPPRRALGGLRPDAIAFGHGAPLQSGATPALHEALATSRRRAFSVYLGAFKHLRG
jgi:hypothetical protein